MGKLFVIEGTDGSGKQTQLEELKKRFDKEKIEYRTVSFPNYDSQTSTLVKMYLSGDFGKNPNDVSPYIASTFYAADRYATFKSEGYLEYYNEGGIILADRYTTSNMTFQSGKIKDEEERNKFLDWLWDFEFNLYGLPVPTKSFFLDMPTKYAQELMQNRDNKFTHTSKKDIHESDSAYLEEIYQTSCNLAKKYDWHRINCIKDNSIRTIEDIHNEIFDEIKKYI